MSTTEPTPVPVPATDGNVWNYSNGEGGTLPDDAADVCLGGYTAVAVQPCTDANPTLDQACTDTAYTAYLGAACATVATSAPSYSLPTTGAGSNAAIGGIGLALVMLGAVLVGKAAVR